MNTYNNYFITKHKSQIIDSYSWEIILLREESCLSQPKSLKNKYIRSNCDISSRYAIVN